MKSNTVVKDAEGKKLIMMASEVVLVFPHQLFKSHPYILNDRHVVLVEEFLFFRQYKFHKQKLKFHRATMKYYQDYLEGKGIKTTYINSYDSKSDIRDLIPKLAE
jgi:deoxyribodipyrimidine photolyase-related protein